MKFMAESNKFDNEISILLDIALPISANDIDLIYDIIQNPQKHKFLLKKINGEFVLLVEYNGEYLSFGYLLYWSCFSGVDFDINKKTLDKFNFIKSDAYRLFYCLMYIDYRYEGLLPYYEKVMEENEKSLKKFVESFCNNNNNNISSDCKQYVKNKYNIWQKKCQLVVNNKENFISPNFSKKYEEMNEYLNSLMKSNDSFLVLFCIKLSKITKITKIFRGFYGILINYISLTFLIKIINLNLI